MSFIKKAIKGFLSFLKYNYKLYNESNPYCFDKSSYLYSSKIKYISNKLYM